MKNYSIVVFEYSKEETKTITELVNLTLIGDMTIYDEHQRKLINRLVGGDRKWFDFDIKKIMEIITIRRIAIRKNENEILKAQYPTKEAKSLAQHLIDNYKVVHRDIERLVEVLTTVDPNHDQNEADES